MEDVPVKSKTGLKFAVDDVDEESADDDVVALWLNVYVYFWFNRCNANAGFLLFLEGENAVT